MDPSKIIVGNCTCGHNFTAQDILDKQNIDLNCPSCGADNYVTVMTFATEDSYASRAENIKESLNFPPTDDLPF